MAEQASLPSSYPVTIPVHRADGSIAQVRVGTATRLADGSGFALKLGEMTIGPNADAPRAASRSGNGPCFPNYGKAKNEPIVGAARRDLEYYAEGCRRSLANPEKARWHDRERELLAVIEAELQRAYGVQPGAAEAPPPSGASTANGAEDIPF